MKNILLLACFCTSLSYAQTFTLSPEKPEGTKPIQIAYQSTPELLAKGVLTCKVYSLGIYPDMFGDMHYKKIYEVPLTGKGNSFTGTFTPDSTARALIFSFHYGNVERAWDQKTNRFSVTQGFVDGGNEKSPYSCFIYQRDGSPRPFANWLVGAAVRGSFTISIYDLKLNVGMCKDLTKTELKLYPSSIDQVFGNLYFFYSNDSVAQKQVFREQTERLFATGLKKYVDYEQLITSLSYLKLNNESQYFMDEMKKKFNKPGLVDDYWMFLDSVGQAKKDKKIAVADRYIKWHTDKLNWGTKVKIPATGYEGPMVWVKKQRIFAILATNPSAFDAEFAKAKFERSNSLLNTDIDLMVLDTLAKVNPERAKVWGNEGVKYYNEVLVNWPKVEKTVLNDPQNFDLFPYQVKRLIEKTLCKFYSRLSGLYVDTNPTLALECATKSEKIFAKELADYGIDQGVLNQVSATINKALPADQAKLRFEKMVKDDTWNQQTVDYLKVIYLNQKGDESKFKSYIDGLRVGKMESLKKELQSELTKTPMPAFKIEKMDGGFISSDDLKGKTVIIDFWATWCNPCIASMPMMQKLVQNYQADPNVVFMFISTSESGEREKVISQIKKLLEKKNLNLPIYYDFKSTLFKQFGLQVLPTKIFVDKEGQIRYTQKGGEGDESQLLSKGAALIELIN